MPSVYPFAALQFAEALIPGADVSSLIAPPYDVLDAEGKARLLAKSPRNIVAIDLPHIPAKNLGPASAYHGAAAMLTRECGAARLKRRPTPAMFAYRQTFTFNGQRHRRTGMASTLDLMPFGPAKGGGVLPHEQTFSGPKEDRLALFRATRTQLSPIFGLHQDAKSSAARHLATLCTKNADIAASTDDGTIHEVWAVSDAGALRAYQNALAGEDIFIADGHHRYTTALNYLKELGNVPADHPARRCMFVLVSMSDPGLVIGPTHRVLSGMSGYSWSAFEEASRGVLSVTPINGGLESIERAMNASSVPNTLGLYDFATKTAALATPAHADPLASHETLKHKPREWRTLDVAVVQHVIVEQICEPKLNGGKPIKWAFPHSIPEVRDLGSGKETASGGGEKVQLAVIVKPTPLEAVRAVSRANELMPQKSTFFLPKLATGLFMWPVA